MATYNNVAPPSQSSDPNVAFADALARARQIAAKIGGGSGDGDNSALKRPFDGDSDGEPDSKKLASSTAAMNSDAAARAQQAAAAAAAQINAKLGLGGGPNNMNQSSLGGPPMLGGLGGIVTETIYVPDRMVGLVIGKGGENITNIQAETGVKVQFAPDSGGMPERSCTLTGPRDGIQKAKELVSQRLTDVSNRKAHEMVNQMIQKGSGIPDNKNLGPGVIMEEIMVGGSKVGLIIGKGGENIKMLQEKANVKMVMIQDSNIPTNDDKPLRISGQPANVALAKQMVFDLLAEKEGAAAGQRSGGGCNEISIPRHFVGVVIGKGGEMIKRITTETGAKVQLKPDDGQGPDRCAVISGSPESVSAAMNYINHLLQDAQQRQSDGTFGQGRGPRMGGPGGMRFPGPFGNGGGPGGPFPGPGGFSGPRGPGGFGGNDTTYIVPTEKTGLIIGKGGETIKQISQQSGAWVELSRDPPPNQRERVFKISGTPDQIDHAMHLIAEKAGLPPPQGGGGSGQGPPQGGFGGGFNNYGGGPGYGGGPPSAPSMGGPPGQQGPGGQWNNPYNYQQQQPWGQPSNPSQAADPAKQAADNAAAWAAYYQNYYQQYQQYPNGQGQPPAPQQPSQQQQQQPAQQAQAQPQAVNPQTGQPDYSAAWAEYYRQQGMYAQAQAILAQAQQQQGGQGGAPTN